MVLTETTIYLYYSIGFNFLVLIVVALFRYKEILCALFPSWYTEVTMIELDNNVRTWLQFKSKDLRFTFNNGVYNMFSANLGDVQNYRNGNIKKFFYFEGYENPVNLKKPEYLAQTKLRNEFLKIDFAKILNRRTGIAQLFGDLLPFIIIGGFIIIIYMISKLGGSPA